MKYHIYIQDEEAGDISEQENPASEGVGYLVEDRFEAENLEEATKIAGVHSGARDWRAPPFKSYASLC